MSRTSTSATRRAPVRNTPAGPAKRRRGTTAQRVAAVIVVIGLVAAVALFASGILRRDPSGSGPTGFPSPVHVASATDTLKPSRSGRVTTWALPQALSAPRDVAIGADGRVWVTEQDTGRVDAFQPPTLTRYATDTFPYVGAFALGAGPGGAMWFTGFPGGSIARILPDGTANGFAPFAESSATLGVAQDGDGAMWVTDTQRGVLIRVGTDASISQFIVHPASGAPAKATAQPRDITQAADGTMWFTDPGTRAVGRVGTERTPTITEFPVVGGYAPRSIASAPDGALWVTLTSRTGPRALARIDPSNGSSRIVRLDAADGTLNDLLIAPDGTLWVSQDAGALLHVRPDGSLIERVKLPDGIAYTDGLARAADGTIWAAATDASALVAVSPAA
jgi:virginiamycin B lyase